MSDTTTIVATESTPATEPHHPKMGLLPPNLAPLAKLCPKESTRYALSGPRLTLTEAGYRVDATDAHTLITVEGDYPADPADYPHVPALATAPNSATQSIVPAKAWQEAFKLPPKGSKNAVLANLAVVIGNDVTTFGSTDLDSSTVKQPRNIVGRYPDVDRVYPPETEQPAVSVRLDALQLAELLTVLSNYSGADNHAITLDVFAGNRPVRLRAANGEQKAKAVIMPLLGK